MSDDNIILLKTYEMIQVMIIKQVTANDANFPMYQQMCKTVELVHRIYHLRLQKTLGDESEEST